MIDIPKLARESGASISHYDAVIPEWWVFAPDELQLYTEKVMLAAQKAERERAKELVSVLQKALEYVPTVHPWQISVHDKARDAIAKCEVSQ